MKIFWRILRIFSYTLLLLLVVAIGALVVLTGTEGGRQNLASLISKMASSEDRKVTVSGIEGIWSGQLRLDHVVLEDRAGPWMVARKVALDWSPTALLSRNFDADRLAAERIELARLPQPSQQPSQGGSTSLPVSIDVRQIDLPEIALGQELAGSGIAELAAKGSVKADPSPLAIESVLNVSRHDGKQGNVDAKIHFAPADNKLDLDLKASEPADGIIANLLKLPDAPPVNIVVTGSGPLANWSGVGTFMVDSRIVTQFTARHQLSDKGHRIEAKGDGEFEPFLPQKIKALFAGKTGFDLAGTATTSGGVDIEQAKIESDAVHGTATGNVDPKGVSDLAVELSAKDKPVTVDVGNSAVPILVAVEKATVRAFGDGTAPKVDIGTTLNSVAVGGTQLNNITGEIHSDGFDIENRTGPVSIKLAAAGLKTDVATLAPLVTGKLAADLSGTISRETVTIEKGTLRSDALNAALTAGVSLADLSMTLKMNADAVSKALPPQVSSLLGERVKFSATATRDPQGAFAANSLEISSGSLSASGTGSMQGSDLQASVKGTLGDVSPLSSLAGTPLAGGINFALTASGPRLAPDFTVSADSASLTAAGRTVKDIKLSAKGKADVANPSADISLTGSAEGQALDIAASLVTVDGKRAIKGLTLALGDNKVSGDLALDDKLLPLGTLTLAVPDIGPLAALADQTATGDINGTIAFAKEGEVPTVTINAASTSIARGDLAAKAITVNALIANYLKGPAISGTIKADSVTSGSTVISGIGIDLKRDGDWTNFAGGATASGIPATATGRVKIANGTTSVEIASGEATVRGIKAAIAEPSSLSIANGVTTIEKLALNLGGGSATVSGSAGQTLDLTANLANLPVALANDFVPGLDGAGTVEGTAHVTGPSSNPDIQFDAKVAGAETSQTRQAGLGPLDLDAAGTYTLSGGVALDHATLSGDKISGKAAGTLNPNGASDFSLDLISSGPSLPLTVGSAESPVKVEVQSLSAKMAGESTQARLDLSAILPSIAASQAKVDGLILALHSDAFDLKGRAGPVSGTVSVDRIALDNPVIAPLIAGKVTAKVNGRLAPDSVAVNSGSLKSDALNSQVAGRISLGDGAVDLNVTADVASSALPASARGMLGDTAKLSAALKRDANGNVNIDGLKLNSGALSADGQASLADGKLAADVRGALSDVSLLSKDAKGSIAFALNAQGPVTAPDLSMTVNSDRLLVAAREITGLKLTATGKADAANPAANVQLTGTVAGQNLQGSAVLATTNGSRAINGLLLSLGPNKISGDLALDDAFVPVGTVLLDLPDIGPLAALALEKAEGNVRGTIAFSKTANGADVVIKANTSAIKRGDLSAKNVAIDAQIANYMAAPVIAGTVRAESVTSGSTVVTGIDVDLKRDGDWTGFSGGATVKNIPAKAAGRVKVANGTTTIEVASGQATVQGIKAAIAQASTVTISNGVTTLDRLVLNLGGGTATVTGKVAQALDISANLAKVPISLANSFSKGLDAAGSISGTVKVTGAPASPSVAFNIDASGVQTSQTRGAGLGGMNVSSSGNFAGNKLAFDANISDGAGLGLKGGGSVTTAGTPTLALNFNGKVPFSFLAAKLAAQGLALNGTANVDVQVRGPASAPVISGNVTTSGARLIDARSGLAVNDIAADVSIGGGVARINRLSGTLSTRGSLSASGTVGINPAQGFPADLSIKLTDGRYTDGRVVTANLGGDLTIKGPLVSAPVVAGTINLARTVITVPDRLPGSLSELDVKHKNAPAAVRAQDKALRPATASGSSKGGSGLALDVTVNAPNQIFIQGRGVDAELGGSLKLTGPASSPQAVGTFTLQRGRLTILAKRLTFTEGTVGFQGSLVPYLNLTATTTTSSATVTIVVSGEATNPKFTFSSVPALPQDEVLAQLIFGQSMSKLSPLQIAQLADAAAQLAGAGGTTSLLDNLRNAIGIDDLDVTTDEKGGTAVSAGKYLNDRTYVTIQKGDKPGSGKATIDLNVGRGVKLRGEANDAGEAKGGVFYEREY
ncbi:translocation/assembly module TamB [Mesorhizobium sp. M2D.F.Ca.ET.185.01.1.1]|uniref:translocation/assembly module TamB domain-containing protein n=5 Tax=Mesorhizobium TaxID=68287 RepID=UPI000FCC1A72|nr:MULTISPECIES: translocation/assembly module TamB domain-containing protein [unclassified Mesorhizobium]TGP80489.1 translocation/assembly module TamB [bacterium M00.F.Ca.ET.227.01.1.1]TGQ00542.1 translocation/assembly module TamB [bacterium M00.F.Ca.ET.221.01.1.1]TGQ02935.1 translocation/assembly module TamB [bacterium M00.F.Ca.ET.222.01.1.1]TGU09327.1 translocation/assembly module TamB [bacterium M00.F.Ca.ET.163.01.1.1]TGU32564.1 translocation/assembly module TamB [bacterium M00.F.Ca.ET.156